MNRTAETIEMPLPVTAEQLTRLSLVRYLLRLAEEQSAQPAPVDSLSILALHDAVEMFLDLVAETTNAPRISSFLDYWTALGKGVPPIHLPMLRPMEKLNKARVALKHHGQRGSSDQIRSHVDTARIFVDDVCEDCFDFALSNVSMSALVKNQKCRDRLNQAQIALDVGKCESALVGAAVAFAIGSDSVHRSPRYSFGHFPNIGLSVLTRGIDSRFAAALEHFMRPLERAIENLAQDYSRTISLVSLGIDLRDYERFRSLTPAVHLFPDGEPTTQWMREPSSSKPDTQWCIDFVIECMLRVEAPGKASLSFERPISINDIPDSV